MAQSRDTHFSPVSPHSSSGGAESFKGTPDTRLTTFSPGQSAKSSKMLTGIAHSASGTPLTKHPVCGYRGPLSHSDKDPFVTPGSSTRLSPTASSFEPISDSPPKVFTPSAVALSSDIGVSRLLAISSTSTISVAEIEALLMEWDEQLCGRTSAKLVNDHVYVLFSDLRDACSVHSTIRSTRKDWKPEFVNPSKIAKDDLPPSSEISVRSGQVLVLATVQQGVPVDVFHVMEVTENFLRSYGQLFAFVRLPSFLDGTFRAVAEFCNASTALAVISRCNNSTIIEGIHIALSPHDVSTSVDDLAEALEEATFFSANGPQRPSSNVAAARSGPSNGVQLQPTFAMYPLMFQTPFAQNMPYMFNRLPSTGQTSPLAPMSPSYPVIGPVYQTPPSPALTTHNSHSPSRPVSSYGRTDARRQNASRVNRSPHHHAAGHHNHVDIQRIRDGIDVRTTIMLRNIPNKVDQAMLKRIVDESSWGKYDFMYLRIDFANDCNVGYAFINFVDPLDIIDFVDARGNQRWNCFKSDKVAEISYATIQGKDCLVQKFRNSSVMLEAPHYRPKLYFTSNGPMPELAGQEEPFPDPDNQSKMKRSCENAEHVGLFTPNAGQHFRDEQRRRRSQYDRGTRLAALEEYDYETAIHHLYGAASQ